MCLHQQQCIIWLCICHRRMNTGRKSWRTGLDWYLGYRRGYAFAGLTRRYLVRPPSMIWPGTLMSTAMFTTMHKSENKTANGWKVSRWNFFLYVWLGSFAWYFLPGLLMPALSYFSVITWFAPKNVVVANLVSTLTITRTLAM